MSIDGRIFEISLPWPCAELSPNGRRRWEKIAAVTIARNTARLLTLDWVAAHGSPQPFRFLKIRANFYPPNKRKFDLDNLAGRMKNYQDGIFDALVWNDNAIVSATYARLDPFGEGSVDYLIWGAE